MEINLTQEESEEMFYTAMCNGLGYLNVHGIEHEVDKDVRNKIRPTLVNPCYEDFLMAVLKAGHEINFIDTEDPEGDYSVKLTLNMIHERMSKVPANRLLEMIKEEDDAETADVILQTVLYGEIIFG
jgi:hypothetical protein